MVGERPMTRADCPDDSRIDCRRSTGVRVRSRKFHGENFVEKRLEFQRQTNALRRLIALASDSIVVRPTTSGCSQMTRYGMIVFGIDGEDLAD